MPIRFRFILCIAALASLSACGPEKDQFAPVCPSTGFLAPAADLAVYRPGSSGRDLTDLVMGGRMKFVHGQCKPGDNGTIATTVTVGADVVRGPAMRGNAADVPIFVAVLEGDRILDKRIYTLRAGFPSNVDRTTVATPEVFMQLPVSATKSAAAYSILAGFQLTPDQLAANRGETH